MVMKGQPRLFKNPVTFWITKANNRIAGIAATVRLIMMDNSMYNE